MAGCLLLGYTRSHTNTHISRNLRDRDENAAIRCVAISEIPLQLSCNTNLLQQVPRLAAIGDRQASFVLQHICTEQLPTAFTNMSLNCFSSIFLGTLRIASLNFDTQKLGDLSFSCFSRHARYRRCWSSRLRPSHTSLPSSIKPSRACM